MNVHRHPLHEGFGEKCAGDRDAADQHGERQHLRVDDAGHAEHRNLDHAGESEITASVAMTAAPSSPAAINSDNRITPEPEVPPTTTP